MRRILLTFVSIMIALSTSLHAEVPTQESVTKLYVATFNRAPDAAGLDYWVNESGLQLEQISQSFFDQSETQELYPPETSEHDFVLSVYDNLFNREPDPAGWAYWEEELQSGRIPKSMFILAVINGAQDTEEYGNDATILENKTIVGLAFADAGLNDVDDARDIMIGVTEDPNTVTSALERYGITVKEITSEGGSISIIDEYNNKIEVTFPKNALSETTLISVVVLSEQPDLPIETRHVSAFEIKPYDAKLYSPVTVKVTYENAVQDINRTALFRRKTDSILAPLADRKFGTDNKTIEAETYLLGVFAEGKMSLDQINNQIGLIYAYYGISWDQKNAKLFASRDGTINKTIPWDMNHKDIWDDYKGSANSLIEYYDLQEILGVFLEGDELWSICYNFLGQGAQEILDKNIPGDPCEKDYVYSITDAVKTIQFLGCTEDNDVFTQLLDRSENIATECKVCFTFNNSDGINLVSIALAGPGSGILYGNGSFFATSSEGSTYGSWSYSGGTITLYPVPGEEELYPATIYLGSDKVCTGDNVVFTIPAWYDEWEEAYYPSESYGLTITNVEVTQPI